MLEELASQAQEYMSQRYLAWGLAAVGLLRVRSLKELNIVVVHTRIHRRAGVQPQDAALG